MMDTKINQALSRALIEGINSSTIIRAYSWYMQIGGQIGYHEFRKQVLKNIKELYDLFEDGK